MPALHTAASSRRARSRARRALAALAIAVTVIAGSAPFAAAHDPIFMSDDQTTPDTGPYLPDGTISWAIYGQVLGAGDTRGFEFDLRDGDELFVGLLIPNAEPETTLADAELPVLEIERPDGSLLEMAVEMRVEFDEPFSNTSYVNLIEVREPAVAGRYRATVVGNAPSRFSVAVGETELFFTDAERTGDRPGNFLEIGPPLQAWYTTPPGGEPTGELAEGEGEIDLGLIEEAMESGEGSLAEGVDEDVVMADDTENEGSDEEPAATDAETAAAQPTADDDSGGATWVAPAVIAVIALGGGAVFAVRRRDA